MAGYTATMLRFLASLLLVTAACAGVASASGTQSLGIDARGATSQIDKLEHYVVSEPVMIHVTAPGARYVALIGVGPDGKSIRVALGSTGQGAFTGAMALPTRGTWSFAAEIGRSQGHDMTESFPLVVADRESNAGAALMAALALASIGGGVGLIGIARKHAA
jgi:hypothetical protein